MDRPESQYQIAEQRVFAAHGLRSTVQTFALGNPVHVRSVETGDGKAVVFLHGFGLCSAHWAPLWERLGGFRCIALDQPGHAGTSGVDFRDTNLRSWYRDFLVRCLDNLGLGSVHLVGHSQGAMQALWLALDAPARVKSVVAIGTPAVAFGAELRGLRVFAHPLLGRLMLSMPKPARAYKSILRGTIGAGAVAKASDDLIRATYLATRAPGFGSTVCTYMRRMFIPANPEMPHYALSDAELGHVRQPVTVVIGDEERFQPPSDVAARVSHLPNARLTQVPGGHEPWLDDVEACSAQVSAALRGPMAATDWNRSAVLS